MATYTLSIEDKVGRGAFATERAVMVKGNLSYEGVYNPNAESKKTFNPEGKEFDTPFSIVHPFRVIARVIAVCDLNISSNDKPVISYDTSVNDAQRKLFETIFKQEYEIAEMSQQGF